MPQHDGPQEATGFLLDKQELKPGLIMFRRSDVKHRNWYCRVKVPQSSEYKTISLNTPDINEARDKAFDLDADIRFRVKHEIPVFEKSFADIATEFSALQKRRAEAGQITMKRWQTIDGHIRLHLIPYAGPSRSPISAGTTGMNIPCGANRTARARDRKTPTPKPVTAAYGMKW